jgi:hypothetical protein
MTTPAKRKGDAGELEVARQLAELTGWPVRRKLGAGRADDTGDLHGLPDTTCQVKSYADCARAIREGLPELRTQQANAGSTFGALLVRRRGGRWAAVMDLEQFATLLREAVTERTPM